MCVDGGHRLMYQVKPMKMEVPLKVRSSDSAGTIEINKKELCKCFEFSRRRPKFKGRDAPSNLQLI